MEFTRTGNPIYDPIAYQNATIRNIVFNARKTWRNNTPDHEAIENFIFFEGRGEFVESLAKSIDVYGKLTEKQCDAVRRIIAKNKERKEQRNREQELLNETRVFLGVPGKKIQIELTVKKIITTETAFGVSFIHICEDVDRNVIIYFGKSNNFPREGETAKVQATVKFHNLREGVKQTVIMRPKMI